MSAREERQYQRDGYLKICERISAGIRRLLYVLPTGGGKTVVAAMLIVQWMLSGKRVLILVHRVELLEQMHEAVKRELGRLGVEPERIGVIWRDDHRTNLDAPIQVASIDTLRRRSKPVADYVVVDEAHHSVAAKWLAVLGWYVDVPVLGLTATPERFDGKPLKDVYDEMIEGPTVQALIEGEWLLKPRVFIRDLGVEVKDLKIQRGDFEQVELERRVSRKAIVSGVWDHIEKHAEDRSGILFACGVKHATKIREDGLARGKKVRLVTGETPMGERRNLVAPGGWLDSGRRRYVVTCDVLTEGYDLPSAKLVVLARPTLSEALYLHMCGRCLRPTAKNDFAPMVLDLTDNVSRFDTPHALRTWSLEKARKVGRRGEPPRAKACPECESVCPVGATACECGHKFPEMREPVELGGELIELERAPCVICGRPCAPRSKRYCLSHKRGSLPLIPCAICGAESEKRSASRGRLRGHMSYCRKHAHGKTGPTLPCAVCGKPSTASSSYACASKRKWQKNAYCAEHRNHQTLSKGTIAVLSLLETGPHTIAAMKNKTDLTAGELKGAYQLARRGRILFDRETGEFSLVSVLRESDPQRMG